MTKKLDVSLDYYRIFYEIVKAGSFSAAAKVLFVSQSSVSQTLSKLEQAVGMSLIERTTKRMKLTAAGEILYQDMEWVMQKINLTQNRLERLLNLEEGNLRIGVSDTICRYHLMPYLTDFKKHYPDIHITLINRPSMVSITALINGEVDLAIVNLTDHMMTPETHVIKLSPFSDVFIASDKMPSDAFQTFEDLLQHPFISLEEGATTRMYTETLFASHHLRFNPDIELSSVDLIFDFVQHGFGIGIVPDYAIPHHQGIRMLTLDQPYPLRHVGIVTLNKNPLTQATGQFINYLTRD